MPKASLKNNKNKIAQNPEQNYIQIKGAKVHNLKYIDVQIPRDKFVVITGLSGSGKSSLAFDTLYAEGQRRYVESLSAYARQFLGRINKPEVEYIKGLPPAIAIEQKVNTKNPRSTVGTSTEIYDYLKLLYARIGQTYSSSGKLVKRYSVADVVDIILNKPKDSKIMILAPLVLRSDRTIAQHLDVLLKQGFTRVEDISLKADNENNILKIDELLSDTKKLKQIKKLNLLIDRLKVDNDEDTVSRFSDSVQTAFFEGHGDCIIKTITENGVITDYFSNRYEADGETFEEPSVDMFSFNNPVGACPRCEGYGSVIGIDEDLVVPNKSLSVYEEAIACWKGEKMSWYKNQLVTNAHKFKFPVHKPYIELTDEQRELIWTGNNHFEGLNSFFKMLEAESYKIQYRVMLARYRGKTVCPDCRGTRLKKDAAHVKVSGKPVHDLVLMPVAELQKFINEIKLNDHQQKIAKRILIEIKNRLQYLCDVGLGYLTLNRLSSTLSGGESQRINLATSLGSSLVGSIYILDEPSIGLHPRDTNLLIKVLKQLKDLGNTVLVVEHEEEIIRAADEIIDVGPLAGRLGGEIVFQGNHEQLNSAEISLTAKYLTGKEKIKMPLKRRKFTKSILVKSVRENNLKGFDVNIPLSVFTVVTGVSGSGKSSLVRDIIFTALSRQLNGYTEKAGKYGSIGGDIDQISGIEFVDQNPIGKSSRSNPVTYIKVWDDVRKLYSEQQQSKIYDFKPAHFSFNVEGGRCEECQGEGEIKVEMQFMADVHLICESCNGKRFKDEVLEVTYQGKNIYDILELTVDEAIDFFSKKSETTEKRIVQRLKVLSDVGLGYVKLGQSSSSLSGGESQRIKLASFLSVDSDAKPKLLIFDEPTTGLHFHDINKLLTAFQALLEKGHTILVIEHNSEVIKCADWVIDLGPEGGDKGGFLVFEGIPEDLVKCEKSYTGKYLKDKLNQ